MSHQMHLATGVRLAVLDDALRQAIGTGEVSPPASQMIWEQQNYSRVQSKISMAEDTPPSASPCAML